MVRGMHRTLRWMAATPGGEVARALVEFLPDVPLPIFAAAIERYRALGLYASHPTMRREGFDRLQAAMLSGGALRHAVAFEDCVAEHSDGWRPAESVIASAAKRSLAGDVRTLLKIASLRLAMTSPRPRSLKHTL